MKNMQAVDKVLESLGDYSHRGDEYRAKCPSHQGESDDSLAICEDDSGKVLLHCHAGCDIEQIVGTLDLDMGDLFSKNGQANVAGKSVGLPPKLATARHGERPPQKFKSKPPLGW